MSDQDTKPDEGVKNDSLTTTDATEVKGQEASGATTEGQEETNGNGHDAATDAATGKNQEMTEADKEKAEEKAETNVNQEEPSTGKAPKEMLKVNRNGCETRQKSDASVLPETDDPQIIRKQVEFYFSDSNLPNDKFLWGKTEGSENKPVPLSLICSFSRMRRFKPYSAVVDALKASKHLVVEGTEGEETIRRKNPYKPAEDRQYQIDDRSTYIKGFGEESSSTQFDIEAFLAQYGEFNSVRLRRADDEARTFKGSIFVEWADKDTAEKFIKLDPQPLWKEHSLKILRKLEYKAIKSQEIRDGTIEMKGSNKFGRPQRGHRGGFNRGARQFRGNHRGSNDDWKKRREEDQRNGFEDRRGRDRGRGRGRGRGNHRGRDRDRAQTDNGHAKGEQQSAPRDDGRPKIHTSKEGEKIMKEENAKSQANGKRSRDEDKTTDAPPAKKVDVKEAVADTA